jgi:hypothetical protein
MQIGVITNPNSRKNKGRPDRAEALRGIVGSLGEVHETDSVDSIKPVLREFLRKRARYWVADGGDGALHWMLRQGLEVLEEDEFRGTGAELPLTMPTNGGTIDFVANNVGIKGDAEALLGELRGAIERGNRIEEVEVDAMLIEGVEVTPDGDEPFRTYGFASAVGGVGQRFYSLYYAHEDPNPRTIVKILAGTVASIPVSRTPLRALPGVPRPLREYAPHMFRPTKARVLLDGMELADTDCTGVNIASMSINLGGVLRLFGKADEPGLMHALVGAPNPLALVRNLPRLHLGRSLKGRNIIDRACRAMVVEALGDELLTPIIDGECYRNLRSIEFKIGPRLRIPKLVGAARRA